MRPLFAILLVGCLAPQYPSPPPCTPVAIDEAFSLPEREAIWEAVDVWHDGTRGAACWAPGVPGLTFTRIGLREDLPITGAPRAVAVYRHGEIFLAMDSLGDRAHLVAIAIHELGHSLGLEHQASGCMMPAPAADCAAGGLGAADRAAFAAVP